MDLFQLISEFFGKLNKLDELIRWGGYTIVAIIIFAETGTLIGFFFPGDSLIVTAGLFAGKGDLSFAVLFFLLSAMAILGDATSYWIGRSTGQKIFSREKSLLFAKDHLLSAKAFYEKYGGKTIVLARFMPIIRTFAPVVAGVGQMPYATFALYNALGGILWVGSMLSIGYFLGSMIPHIESKIDTIILGIIFLSILPGIIEYIRHRGKKGVGA
jgi:membrane-associated protein